MRCGPAPPPGTSANCLFEDDGSAIPIPALPELAASGESSLVWLSPAQLTDGPWCPDAVSANRFDADLLRIRKVAVHLRIEAALAALRGPASALFVHGGTSKDARRMVPDLEARFDVSPRNLNFEK